MAEKKDYLDLLIEKVSEEKDFLDLKIQRLSSFIGSDKFKVMLSEKHRALLNEQLNVMQHYSEILDKRVEDFSGQKEESNG